MTTAIDRRLAEALSRDQERPARRGRATESAGALFVDTRRREQRDEFGVIPGSIVIDRNVLEWRLDPTSAHRDPTTAEHHGPIVVYCQQGYSSVLAVAELDSLGVPDVYDLAGGFDAWAAAGLPIVANS